MTITQSLLLYAGVLLLSGILLIFSKKYKHNIFLRYTFLILGLFPLFFIMAFRYDVGTDYFSYINIYQRILDGHQVFKHEPGFTMIYQMLQMFTLQSQSIIILSAFLYVLFLGLVIDEEDVNPLLALFILFASPLYFVAFNNIRQQLACIFMLYGFRYILKHNFWAYAGICIVSAYFFHLSSLMLLFLYPLANSKILRKYYYIWMPLILLLSPFLVQLYVEVMKFLGYGDYITSMPAYARNYLPLIKNTFIFIVLFIGFRFSNIKNNNKIYALFMIQFLAIIFSIFTYQVKLVEINERVTFYFMMFQVISIPLAIKEGFMKNKWLGICLLIIILCVESYFFYDHIILNGHQEVLPYEFVFGHWKELIATRPENKARILELFKGFIV